jgi:hypothetical protein
VGVGDFDLDETQAWLPMLGIASTVDTTLAQTFEVTLQWSIATVNNSFKRHFAILELL